MNQQQILLHYGVEDAMEEIFHAFLATDPHTPSHRSDADMKKELADMLGIDPNDDRFYCSQMYIALPASLIQRIQKDAITAYLEKGAETFICENPELAGNIYRILKTENLREDVSGQIHQRTAPEHRTVTEGEIAKITGSPTVEEIHSA